MKKKHLTFGMLSSFIFPLYLTSCMNIQVGTLVNVTYDFGTCAEVKHEQVISDTQINTPSIPSTCTDLVFQNWYTSANFEETSLVTFPFVVKEDITFYAKFSSSTPEKEYYNVTFDSQGGTSVDSISVEKGKSIQNQPETTRNGFFFQGWYEDLSYTKHVSFPYTPSQSTILYAKWLEQKPETEYLTINFNSNGGSTISSQKVEKGHSINSLPTPTKYNNDFIGWYEDSNLTKKVNLPYTPVSDITLYAKWQPSTPETKYFTVRFNSNRGTTINAQTIEQGKSIEKLPTPIKSGYTFLGWYEDPFFSKKASEPFTPTSDITLHANWEVKTYTLTLKKGTNQNLGSFTTDKINSESDLSKYVQLASNEEFTGWYKDSNLQTRVSFPLSLTENTTLYLGYKIIESYTVTFVTSGSKVDPITVQSNNNVIESEPQSTLADKLFAGWYTQENGSGDKINFPYSVTKSITLYAYFTEIPPASEFLTVDENGAVYLKKDLPSQMEVEIPSTLEGKEVKSIKSSAFESNKMVTSLILPEKEITIESNAFRFAFNLTNIQFPKSHPVHLESGSLQQTSITRIELPDGSTVGEQVFEYCESLEYASLNCPKLPYNLFRNCSALSTLILREGVEQIIGGAINYTNLTELTLPKSVKFLDDTSINWNSKLLNVTALNTTDMRIIGNPLNSTAYAKNESNYINKILYLENYAIGGNYSNKISGAVSFKDGTVGISRGVNDAFNNSSITTITIPGSVKYISDGFASSVTSATSVIFNEGLEDIDTDCFQDLSRECLKSIVLPQSLKHVGKGSFEYCISKLQASDYDSAGLFYSGATLLSAKYAPDRASDLTSVPDQTYQGYTLNIKEGTNIIKDETLKELSLNTSRKIIKIILPNSLLYIPESFINGFDSVQSVTFNNPKESKLIEIGESAFTLNKLTEFIFPENLKTIRRAAFNFNTSLDTLIVPASVKYAESGSLATRSPNSPKIYLMHTSLPDTFAKDFNVLYTNPSTYYLYSETRPSQNPGSYWHFNSAQKPEIYS